MSLIISNYHQLNYPIKNFNHHYFILYNKYFLPYKYYHLISYYIQQGNLVEIKKIVKNQLNIYHKQSNNYNTINDKNNNISNDRYNIKQSNNNKIINNTINDNINDRNINNIKQSNNYNINDKINDRNINNIKQSNNYNINDKTNNKINDRYNIKQSNNYNKNDKIINNNISNNRYDLKYNKYKNNIKQTDNNIKYVIDEQKIVDIQRELMDKIWNYTIQERLPYFSQLNVVRKFNYEEYYSIEVSLLENYVIRKVLKGNMLCYNLFKSEVKALLKLNPYPYFPKLYTFDPKRYIIYMSYCGERLNRDNLPDDWLLQFREIADILLKENITSSDIVEKNICVLNNRIHIIDFGMCNEFSESVNESLRKLYNILKKYSKKYINNY